MDENEDEQYRIIQCSAGTVMAIVVACGGVEFIQGYCRKAMIDRWGVYCSNAFRRSSNAGLTYEWAVQDPGELFIFTPIRLELIPEEDWMGRKSV